MYNMEINMAQHGFISISFTHREEKLAPIRGVEAQWCESYTLGVTTEQLLKIVAAGLKVCYMFTDNILQCTRGKYIWLSMILILHVEYKLLLLQ